jgi:hypothetical protein
MNKSFNIMLVLALATSSLVICSESPKKPDIRDLVRAEVSAEQKLKFTEFARYQNIVKAEDEVLNGAPVQKSLKQLMTSLNNLVQTYATELSRKLNAEEKAVLIDICTELKTLIDVIKNDAPKLYDTKLDPAEIEQKAAELDAKYNEHCQQLILKSIPFIIAFEEGQNRQPEEMNKKLEQFYTQLSSHVEKIAETLKK